MEKVQVSTWLLLVSSCYYNISVASIPLLSSLVSTYKSSNPTNVVEGSSKSLLSSLFSSSSSGRRNLSSTTTESSIINPYTSGCLHSKGVISQIRVCNSEDPPDASTKGICRIPDIDFMEIRIYSDNWESITFEAWILQIILSELLDVPTTIEAGNFEGSLNLYHPDAPMTYGSPGADPSLQRAYEIGDCRLANKDINNYEPCCHLDPERWTSTF
jgi:hypothetical protein